jgi:hypothetical protein
MDKPLLDDVDLVGCENSCCSELSLLRGRGAARLQFLAEVLEMEDRPYSIRSLQNDYSAVALPDS